MTDPEPRISSAPLHNARHRDQQPRSGLPLSVVIREGGDEDVFLTSRLREDFDVAVCHPLDAAAQIVHVERRQGGLRGHATSLGPPLGIGLSVVSRAAP